MGKKKSKFRHNPENGKPNEAAAAASSSAVPAPPWIELPEDITANILQRLGAQEILQTAQMVCTTWRKVSQDPSLWRIIYWTYADPYDAAFNKMCRNAVDRSQGQLIDLTISGFLNDELMNYIADRASHLRRLRLEWCLDISSRAFTQSVKKLGNLEELHLFCVPFFEVAEIESVGISCPLLKSFTLRQSYRDLWAPDDDYDRLFASCTHAFAIAKTMPNLVHLRVVGLVMKGVELEAILNGCPHLESLDLRKCYHLIDDVGGELIKRCLKQVKYVRDVMEELSDSDEFDGDNSGHDDVLRREDSDASSSGSSVDSDDDGDDDDDDDDEPEIGR